MSMHAVPEARVRRSARAKYLRLVIKPGAIELVAPLCASERQVHAFLQRHRAWAESKYLEMGARFRSAGPGLLETGATLPWRGREIPLQVQEGSGRQISIAIDDSASVVMPGGLGGDRESVLKHALFAWIRRWLHAEVARLAARHGALRGLQPRAIRIKRMSSRWGSCGPRGDININWLLAFTPDAVLEYVVVHELCHLLQRNHSIAFWELVSEHLPEHARERAWLRAHGSGLIHRFSAFPA